MSSLTKPKLVLYLAAIFLAGGVSGAFLGYNYSGTAQRAPRTPPSPEQMTQFLHDKLVKDIGITEEQWAEIAPMSAGTIRAIGEADAQNRERIGRLISENDARIMEKMNPEQKARMEAWIAERRQHHKSHRGNADKK